jgi:hypothetical protein
MHHSTSIQIFLNVAINIFGAVSGAGFSLLLFARNLDKAQLKLHLYSYIKIMVCVCILEFYGYHFLVGEKMIVLFGVPYLLDMIYFWKRRITQNSTP